ncbi:MAG: DUF5615 family PIN-like protein [Tepidisphaerales bacterium]
MRFLLDQGLPRSTVDLLRQRGHDAVHVSDVGMARADDSLMMDRAESERSVVVTLDADFHAIMALTGRTRPSVIRIRVEGLKANALADMIARVLAHCQAELEAGAVVTVDARRIRVRKLRLK